MKPRIAISYYDADIGGPSVALCNLLDFLKAKGFETNLFLFQEGGPLLDFYKKRTRVFFVGRKISKASILWFSIRTFKCFRLFFTCLGKESFLRRFKIGLSQIGGQYRALKSFFPMEEYDISLGFMEFWANEYALKLKARRRIAVIHPEYKTALFSPFLDWQLFKKADKICFVSKTNCASFNTFLNNEFAEKVSWFPNLVFAPSIRALAEENPLQKPRAITLLTAARLIWEGKGFDRVVDVAFELAKENIDFLWFIIGPGETDQLRQAIARKGLEKHFRIDGPQTNPYRYMNICDWFVLLSRHEGRPLSVDEALTLGKPCIVADYPAAKEQIKNGQNGYIVSNKEFSPSLVASLIKNMEKQKTLEDKLRGVCGQQVDEERTVFEVLNENE